MWVRGLKLASGAPLNQVNVAPYVGAWIETAKTKDTLSHVGSHPMWVRGLKLNHGCPLNVIQSRTLCGCVD